MKLLPIEIDESKNFVNNFDSSKNKTKNWCPRNIIWNGSTMHKNDI